MGSIVSKWFPGDRFIVSIFPKYARGAPLIDPNMTMIDPNMTMIDPKMMTIDPKMMLL